MCSQNYEVHIVYRVEIYPADSVVRLSQNWAQADSLRCGYFEFLVILFTYNLDP